MDRISQICSRLERCGVFADVGCDHGYCTQYMLKNNLCDRAIISDISEKSLNKARTLLKDYCEDGRVEAVCCDGLTGVEGADLVLIAGMGGEEIIKILNQSGIPPKFVFQPMSNLPKVREYLINSGCAIEEDNVFADGKYYFIIKGRKSGGSEKYNSAQLAFGRDSLKNPVLKEYLSQEAEKIRGYLSGSMLEENRRLLENRLQFITGVYEGET